MPQKEIITLKGTGDGVIIRIACNSAGDEIIRGIADKIRENRNFFRGCCNIYIEGGSELSRSDELRINSVIDTFLPGCSVTYRLPGQNPRCISLNERNDEKYHVINSKGALETAAVHEGDIHEHEHLRVVGNALIIGDICEKAKVTAGGNIIVLGSVSGDVRAGYPNDDKAYIIFKTLKSCELSIGKNVYKNDIYNVQKYEKEEQYVLKKAQSINNSIFITNFL